MLVVVNCAVVQVRSSHTAHDQIEQRNATVFHVADEHASLQLVGDSRWPMRKDQAVQEQNTAFVFLKLK